MPEVTSFVARTCAVARFHIDEGVVAEVADGTLVITPLGFEVPVQRDASEAPARLAAGPWCGADGAVLEIP